jgi:GT2 family glycosyltransferase
VIAEGEPFAVVIPTRNRPAQLHRLLDSLSEQTRSDHHVVIVDQSDEVDSALSERVDESDRLHLVHDDGRGASRARNVGWRMVGAEWIAYLDDDCIPEPGWAAALHAELGAHPAADLIMGDVTANNAPDTDYLPVAVFPVSEPQVLTGRFIRPWRVSYSVAVAIRRSALDRIGGWDERFGPGARDYPASDDMDLSYRLLRSGGTAYLTPRLRASHDQWRTSDQLLELYGGYSRAWGGLVVKQLRSRDPLGAAIFVAGRLRGIARLVLGAARARSRFRLRLAGAELRGFAAGLAKGLRQTW